MHLSSTIFENIEYQNRKVKYANEKIKQQQQ